MYLVLAIFGKKFNMKLNVFSFNYYDYYSFARL